MITKFNLFESVNDGEVQVGDYILHKSRRDEGLGGETNQWSPLIYDILATTIGQVLSINGYKEARVRFDSPINIMFIDLDKIEYWSKNRKDLEALLAGKDYNL